ncbi:MAG: hypothetical protein ACRDRT_00660 [Pseudonocardiaceae bacterium]
MTLRRLSVDETCKDGYTCPGVWADEGEEVIIVGEVLDPSPVPLAPGERAVRLRRQVIRDAHL